MQRKMLERRLVVLAIAASLLNGCGRASSERPAMSTCPPVVDYGAAEQAEIAAALDTLPDDAVLAAILSDYAVMRDQARACGSR